ncbi:DNA polymerase III subunit beta [Fibrobacterota bacterium]
MKFESKKGSLLEAIQLAQNAIPSKTTLQVLNNFLLKLEGNSLEITATDLDLSIILKIEVEGSQDGSIVVNAKKLLEVVRELPDLPVFCSVDEYVFTIKSGKSFQCNITGFDASEYPAMPEESREEPIQMEIKDLKFLYEKSSFAVSADYTTRISLTGMSWECNDNKLIMVGTDGHKLGKAWIESKKINLKKGIILPPRAINQVLKTMPDNDSVFQIEVGEANIKFHCEDVTIYSKLIEGPYPDYEKVIPKELSRTISINREDLISVLRRVATMAHFKTRQVKFSFEEGTLLLSARNQDLGGDSEETLPVKYQGKPTSIGYNGTYVLEVLRLINSEEVSIKFNTNLGATIFEPDQEDSNYFFIIMPLRLLEDE